MSGEGADEILLGYDLFREAKIRRFWARDPELPLSRPFAAPPLRLPAAIQEPALLNLMLANFYRPSWQVDDPHYAMAVRWANGKAMEACFSRTCKQRWRRQRSASPSSTRWLPPGYREADDMSARRRSRAMTLLGNYLLSSQGDRMAWPQRRGPVSLPGSRIRPLRRRLPQDIKLRGLKDKFILRETYGDEIPEDGAQAQEVRLSGAGEEVVLRRMASSSNGPASCLAANASPRTASSIPAMSSSIV